jgi:hypothetical protein
MRGTRRHPIAWMWILPAPMLLGNGTPEPVFRAIAADDAIAYFKHICVDTMPSPDAFAAALNGEPPGWRALAKSEGGFPVVGHFWRSELGELSYQNLPGVTETNPGCHYTFRTAPGYSHDEAAGALARLLGLDQGRRTGKKKAPQTRWEVRLSSGLRVRLFLSSSVRDLGEPAATLSVSAYPRTSRGG